MTELDRQIRAILSEKDSWGSFKYERVATDGTQISHRCCHATGLKYSHFSQGYRQQFGGDLPAWVELLAPNKAANLYELALAKGMPLPSRAP